MKSFSTQRGGLRADPCLPGMDVRERATSTRGTCMRCGRRLSDPNSVKCALGPACRRLSGLVLKTNRTTVKGLRR